MANTYKALSSVTVGSGGVASVSFTNIPQTYTDLVIQISARSNYAAGSYGDGLRVSFNSDTSTNNYSNQLLQGYDSSFSAGYNATSNSTGLFPDDAAAQTANVFSNNNHYIPNYAGNTNVKTLSVQNVVEKNGATQWVLQQYGVLWNNTAPVTSITYTPSTSFVFKEFTTFTLYGVFNADVSSAPATPTIGTATAGVASASITFTGVSNAASYTMTSTPGSITGTGTTSPITVSGLTGGTAYTFKVKSNNPFGSSAESAASNSVTPLTAAYESIATVTVGGSSVSNIEFTSIPSDYTHLQLRLYGHLSGSGNVGDIIRMTFNSDTAANYSWHLLQGNGTTVSGDTGTGASFIYSAIFPDSYGGANFFGTAVIDILDYKNTNKYKTTRSLLGYEFNDSNYKRIALGSGNWRSFNAITSIKFVSGLALNMTQYTRIALYGIKA